MKIAVRYQSRGGNTKKVAEVIANKVGVKAETIDVPITEPVDILFVGGGVYAHTIDSELTEFLSHINAENVKLAAAFSTGGGMDGTKKIIPALKSLGITVHAESLPIKLGLKNHAVFVKNGHLTLSAKQVKIITNFVEKVIG